jgi:hypothetical protein
LVKADFLLHQELDHMLFVPARLFLKNEKKVITCLASWHALSGAFKIS